MSLGLTPTRRFVHGFSDLFLAARRLLGRTRARSGIAPNDARKRSTPADVHYSYRLLLHRDCTRAEWTMWKEQLRIRRVTLAELTHRILTGDEFRGLQARQHQPQLIELDGFRLYVRPHDFLVGTSIAANKVWEPHVTAQLRRVLKPGGVFVDVGANIGYFAMLAASLVGKTGKVLAFEPNPDNCEQLSLSLRANGFANVELHACAVADREKTVTVYPDTSSSLSLVVGDHSVPDSMDAVHLMHASAARTVRVCTLDTALQAVPRVDVVKIDTDGYEPEILQGMHETIRKYRPVLLTEFAPRCYESRCGTTGEAYLEALFDHGYRVSILSSRRPERPAPADKNQILRLARRSSRRLHLDLLAEPEAPPRR